MFVCLLFCKNLSVTYLAATFHLTLGSPYGTNTKMTCTINWTMCSKHAHPRFNNITLRTYMIVKEKGISFHNFCISTQLRFSLKWQSLWSAIANYMRKIPIQSNNRNYLQSGVCTLHSCRVSLGLHPPYHQIYKKVSRYTQILLLYQGVAVTSARNTQVTKMELNCTQSLLWWLLIVFFVHHNW